MAQRPVLFFSFTHREPDLQIVLELQRRVEVRGILVYTIRQDPLVASDHFSVSIPAGMAICTGVVSFWSGQASSSFWVRMEYAYAGAMKKPVCLILFPGTNLPEDWPKVHGTNLPDAKYVQLRSTSPFTPEFDEVVEEVVRFAEERASG